MASVLRSTEVKIDSDSQGIDASVMARLEQEKRALEEKLEVQRKGRDAGGGDVETLEKMQNMSAQMRMDTVRNYQSGVKSMVRDMHNPMKHPAEAIANAVGREGDETAKVALSEVGMDIAQGMQLPEIGNMMEDNDPSDMEGAYLMRLRDSQYEDFKPIEPPFRIDSFEYSFPVYYK